MGLSVFFLVPPSGLPVYPITPNNLSFAAFASIL